MDNKINLTETEKSIIKTIAHFDILNYPLTLIELYKHMNIKSELIDLKRNLKELTNKKVISIRNGFYFLNHRVATIKIRHNNYRLFLKKINLIKFIIKLINYFPWIRVMGIYSSLSYKYFKKNSDIDLFFITEKNRIWSARFFLNTVFKILKLRPTKKNSKDKLCPSYWVDRKELSLLEFNYDKDYLSYYSLSNFVFFSEEKEIINDFFLKNNWLKIITPNWQPINFNTSLIKKNLDNNKEKRILEFFLKILPESFYKKIQFLILPKTYFLNQDNKKVVLSNHVIKLHDKDKRQEYNRLFKENYEKYLASINN